MKEAAALSAADGNEAPASAEPAPPPAAAGQPVLKFRNYTVRDEKHIQHDKVAQAQPPKFIEPVIEKKVEEGSQEDVVVNVAPKKANWDLKRDVEKKLDKLERRTQRAILEIMQQEESNRMQQGATQD